MKKSKYSDSQILAIFNQSEAGTPVPELCREHGMSSATFYKWRAKYGGKVAEIRCARSGTTCDSAREQSSGLFRQRRGCGRFARKLRN